MKKPKREGLEAAHARQVAAELMHQQAAAMRASMDGMAILDRAGRFVFINEAQLRIYGYSAPEELIGATYRGLYAPEELRRFEESIMPTFWKTGHWRGEATGKRRDGTTFPQEISLSRIEDDNGDAAGLVCVVRDITERKRAEETHSGLLQREQKARAQAEAASRAKDEFLAVVSHELRTPITAILGWTWLLRSGEVAPAELGKALEVIERNMKLQAQIIEDLLDVSSIVNGKMRLDLKPLELGEIILAALEPLKPLVERGRIHLETALAPGVPINGDARRLQQVFWNLLSNAIKFNREGGFVRATLKIERDCASVVIEDDGQGIDPALLPEICDLFRQEEDSLTRQHRGLGLGLTIVRRLVELHGGSVSAASAGRDKGSSFTVLLPLLPLAAKATSPSTATKSAAKSTAASKTPFQGALNGVSILAVENDPDTLVVMAELLKYCGASVATACSALEALEAIQRGAPDILLSDLMMPEMNGYALIRKVREMKGGLRIRALALSALTLDEDSERARAAGFDNFLSKPVELERLVATLRALAGLV